MACAPTTGGDALRSSISTRPIQFGFCNEGGNLMVSSVTTDLRSLSSGSFVIPKMSWIDSPPPLAWGKVCWPDILKVEDVFSIKSKCIFHNYAYTDMCMYIYIYIYTYMYVNIGCMDVGMYEMQGCMDGWMDSWMDGWACYPDLG